MAENDEPLDDLRAVSMTAAAAAARVVETVVRDQQRRAEDARRFGPQAGQQVRDQANPNINPNWLQDHQAHVGRLEASVGTELTPPSDQVRAVMDRIARGEHRAQVDELVGDMLDRSPGELFEAHPAAREVVSRAVADTIVDPQSASADPTLDQMKGRYLRGYGMMTEQPYDSHERRAATDQAMRAAGVPDEVRHAATTADLLNGVDPQQAASAGTTRKTQTKPSTKAPERARSR